MKFKIDARPKVRIRQDQGFAFCRECKKSLPYKAFHKKELAEDCDLVWCKSCKKKNAPKFKNSKKNLEEMRHAADLKR